MTVLFMFLDGVGLGNDDPAINPFVCAEMPNLQALLNGQKLISAAAPFAGERASLLGIDACLGVEGLPQSATGQAVLLTGQNIPAEMGHHYGPKPDKATAAYLQDGGIFGVLSRAGKRAALVNAYPARYFEGIETGRRLYSAIPLAVTNAGLALFSGDDLVAGRAISADLTAQGWREHMLMPEVEVLSPAEAGAALARIAGAYDFAFFEYWLTDYAGHGQNMEEAVRLLAQFDAVLGGLLGGWDAQDLILITSDHGNLEDLSTRRHTSNPVPLLLIGDRKLRQHFEGIADLTGVFPAILHVLGLG
jgi:hypothetical protein